MTNGLIVVGVDGSDESRLALEWAIDEARLRDAEVLAVYAWLLVPVAAPDMPDTLDWELLQQSAVRFLSGFVPADPDVPLRRLVANGPAADALVEASEGADLLVVGSRGLGGARGLLLGSVSAQCVRHANCPVVVVHGAQVPALV
jgi:nucleotide-binding universal stress UspA family protein